MARYKIWNGTDTVYTYGAPYKFTPEQWAAKYPWSEVEPCVISGEGAINGAFCMPLSNMVANATKAGCDFSACRTNEDRLAAIEAFEDMKEAEAKAEAAHAASASERTAAALEAIATGTTAENTAAIEALLTGEEDIYE